MFIFASLVILSLLSLILKPSNLTLVTQSKSSLLLKIIFQITKNHYNYLQILQAVIVYKSYLKCQAWLLRFEYVLFKRENGLMIRRKIHSFVMKGVKKF